MKQHPAGPEGKHWHKLKQHGKESSDVERASNDGCELWDNKEQRSLPISISNIIIPIPCKGQWANDDKDTINDVL